MRLKSLLLLAAISSTAGAQTPVADVRANWRNMHNYIRQSAELLPEDKFGWKPTSEVRSFAELFAHVATDETGYCAIALGQAPPAEVKATTKAAVLAALEKSAQACEKAYAQTDAASMAMTDMYGQQRTRFRALVANAGHDAEHYGNLITYLRMNKIVPPSSR